MPLCRLRSRRNRDAPTLGETRQPGRLARAAFPSLYAHSAPAASTALPALSTHTRAVQSLPESVPESCPASSAGTRRSLPSRTSSTPSRATPQSSSAGSCAPAPGHNGSCTAADRSRSQSSQSPGRHVPATGSGNSPPSACSPPESVAACSHAAVLRHDRQEYRRPDSTIARSSWRWRRIPVRRRPSGCSSSSGKYLHPYSRACSHSLSGGDGSGVFLSSRSDECAVTGY